jgi:HAD superfamily hydrolase (TIGR01509 family)
VAESGAPVIELVIFDMDGVLVDLCAVHRTAFRLACLQHHVLFSNEQEEAMEGLPTNKKLDILGVKPEIGRLIASSKQLETLEAMQKLETDPVRLEMLRAVAESHHVACLSNSLGATARAALSKTGLVSVFEGAVFGNDDPGIEPKPSPDGYKHVCASFGLNPDRVLVFEDSQPGVAAAADAGCFVVKTSLPFVTKEHVLFALKQTNKVIKCNS